MASGAKPRQNWSFEDPTNDNFPNAMFAFSMGVGHDPDFLNATSIAQGSALVGMNGGMGPQFWAPALLPNGSTVGA